MQLFGVGYLYLIGGAVLLLAVVLFIAMVFSIALIAGFWKTRKIIFPRVTLMLVGMLEVPIKHILWAFNVNTDTVNNQDFIDLMLAEIRNKMYRERFKDVPFDERAFFLPQCLRHRECPARLSSEGIECVNCGRCKIGEIKEEAEELGYNVYVIPGGSFIKRLVKERRPKAILGVGCHTEIKEGLALTSALGLPAQGVPLVEDGCVDTSVNWDKVRKVMKMNN